MKAAAIAGATALHKGLDAIRKREWSLAFSLLTQADSESGLGPDELLQAATAAHLTGRDQDAEDLLKRSHQGFLAAGDVASAARCGFWLSLSLSLSGDFAQCSGWLARCRRLLDAHGQECVECGYMTVLEAIMTVFKGDPEAANPLFVRAAEIARRFGDRDLIALAIQGEGRTLIRRGEIERGVSLLDEAMAAVMAGDVSAMAAGGIYCSLIEACSELFDLRRAQEWTQALEQWCSSQGDVAPYRGHCMVRRSELLELSGAWDEARVAADLACEKLSQPAPKPALGGAYYRLAEVHRLRGEFAAAEEAYRKAAEYQRTPQPGIALLRLDQGNVEAALAAIQPLMNGVRDPRYRPAVLSAYVEIALAANRLADARAASEELAECARRIDTLWLRAMSAHAAGAVLLSEGKFPDALDELHQALHSWQELKAPYHAARVRMAIGQVHERQGNRDAAELEFQAARAVFEQLGASVTKKRPGPLTSRETEVLKLIASGATNREIANKLHISEKTVARHVSNIFVKLDLSSRAAATAYAYQNSIL
jgi:DNA-binding NarL/FixJ family response regulator